MSGYPRLTALAPFRVSSFRFQWPADLATSWAFEMETLILGWYVLVETGSVLYLTLFGALQFLGTLFSPLFGVAGDRFGPRTVLYGMRASYAALALALMGLAFAGALTPLVVLGIAALSGLVRPSDLAMRGALVAETMPTEHLMAAMGISRTTSDTARIAGALTGAGLFALLGMGMAYLAVTACYLLGLCLTLGVAGRRRPARGAADTAQRSQSSARDLREGMAYVWSTPRLLAAMWLAFLVNLTAFPLTGGLLPYVAREVYGIGQAGLGMLVASFALGALVGSIGLSLAGTRIRSGRMMILSALAWYVALLAFAHTESAAAGIALLMLAGLAQSLSMVPLAVMLLRTSAARLRGRVMGVRMLAIYGLPLGLIAAGVLVPSIGFAATATAYAAAGLVLTLAIAVYWRADLWPLAAEANGR